MLTPEHSSPHCMAKWGLSGFNGGQANRFENLNCSHGPWSLFACLMHSPHPHSAKHGKGTAFGDQRIVALVSVLQTMIITHFRLYYLVRIVLRTYTAFFVAVINSSLSFLCAPSSAVNSTFSDWGYSPLTPLGNTPLSGAD